MDLCATFSCLDDIATTMTMVFECLLIVILQGSLGEQEGFDLVHLCATFSASPFIMAFAQVTYYNKCYLCICAVLNKLSSRPMRM